MPRNFTQKQSKGIAAQARFNEAAADAAEFSQANGPGHTSESRFNEAAADAAEF